MNPFELYRDDGPLARVLGATLGAVARLPASALLAAGVLPLLSVLAIEGGSASDPAIGAVFGWLVVLGGASRGRPHTDVLRWAVPPLLRLGEYAAILWLGALAGGSGPAAAFALLTALAYHHYDLFYRPRFLGAAPPRWLGDVAGGWEGRLIAAYVLLLAGALPAALFAMAGILGVLFVTESILSWTRNEVGVH
jgi:predicted outer membrane lipoprotein